MVAPQKIDSLADIAADYDAILCDAWGVIHGGRFVFDGVAAALTAFRQARGPVVILTNAPKPSHIIPGQLDVLGLPREAYDGVATSGDATRAAIEKQLPAPAYRIGWRSDGVLYEGLDVTFSSIDEAGFIICTGLTEDGPSDPAGYRDLLAGAAARGAPMVCANPDIVVNWRGELMWCAGAIARVYEEMGGSVVYAGKPYPAIYDLALEKINAAAGAMIDRKRILAIGDGAGTDILGANKAKIDALYIASPDGVHAHYAEEEAASIGETLAKAGVSARYWMEGLK